MNKVLFLYYYYYYCCKQTLTILVILHFLWIIRMNKITLRCTMPLMGELKKAFLIMRRAYSKPTKRNRNVHF